MYREVYLTTWNPKYVTDVRELMYCTSNIVYSFFLSQTHCIFGDREVGDMMLKPDTFETRKLQERQNDKNPFAPLTSTTERHYIRQKKNMEDDQC